MRNRWEKKFGERFLKSPWRKEWGACHMLLGILTQAHTWEEKRGKSISSLHRWTFHQIPISKAYIQCWAMHVWHTFILHRKFMNQMLMKASTSWDAPPTLTLYPCGYQGAVFFEGSWWAWNFWGSVVDWKCQESRYRFLLHFLLGRTAIF